MDAIGILSTLYKQASEFIEIPQNVIKWREAYNIDPHHFETHFVDLNFIAGTPLWAGYSDKTAHVYYWKETVSQGDG